MSVYKFCPSTIPRGNVTEIDRERETYVGIRVTHRRRSQLPRTAALGLWEGLSHSALLGSIVSVLKVVAAKTNWWEK